MRSPLLLPLALCLLSALACGQVKEKIAEKVTEKVAEKIVEGQSGQKVDLQKDGITMKGENGQVITIGSAATVPADWPKDVPLYAGITLNASTCSGTVGQSGWSCVVSFHSADTVDKVASFYLSNLSGWEKQVDARTNEGATLIFKKGSQNFSFSVSPGGDGGSDGMVSVNQD